MFQSGGNVEEVGRIIEEICVGFEDNSPQETENALNERVKEGVKSGPSKH